MTLPGVSVKTEVVRPNYSPLTAIDQWMAAGMTETGPTEPLRHFSAEEWKKVFGGPVSWSVMQQEVEGYFGEGGYSVLTSRTVGPTPVKAAHLFKTTGPAECLKFEALYYGEYGNAIEGKVVGSETTRTITIKLGSVEKVSGALTTLAEIVAFVNATGLAVASITGSGLPTAVAFTAFSGGTDNHSEKTDANDEAALARFDSRYGPGTVSLPGRTTEAAHLAVYAHCVAFDRVPDVAFPTGNSATVLAGSSLIRTQAGAGSAGGVAPWVTNTNGVSIPPEFFLAAKVSSLFRRTGNPNLPAAGENGEANWITGLANDFSDLEREELDAGGVNVIWDTDRLGTFQLFDFDTLGLPADYPTQTALSNAYMDMFIRWGIRKIAQPLLFKPIDPKGKTAGKLHSRVQAFLEGLELWSFAVDTASVNTPLTASETKLNVKVSIEREQYAKQVQFTLEIQPIPQEG